MTIVALIQRIVKNRFGTYFNGIESFYLKNFRRFPQDHSRAILTSTDTRLSGERIIQYDSLRWSIESFFKFAKQNLSLSNCQISSEQAQKY